MNDPLDAKYTTLFPKGDQHHYAESRMCLIVLADMWQNFIVLFGCAESNAPEK
jgi:hypothetical protein